MATLEVHRDGEVIHRQELRPRGVRIGRAPDNDLALADATISSYHCIVFVRGGTIKVRDLGSTNGTFVDDAKVEDIGTLAPGGTLRLGPTIVVEIKVEGALSDDDPERAVFLYQTDAGCYHSLDEDWVSLGKLLDDPAQQEVEVRAGAGEVEVRQAGKVRSADVNTELVFGTYRLRVMDSKAIQARTKSAAASSTWRLSVDMGGRAGPVAQILPPGTSEPYSMRAGNRVSVLYLLAKQVVADLADDVGVADQGWCPDDQLMSGVWGRRWEEKGSASFQVLIHRVRKDLQRIGLGADVVEKRSGFTRIRPGKLEVIGVE